MGLNRSLFLCILFSFFSNLSQAKTHIDLGDCGDTGSRYYKSISEVKDSFKQLMGQLVQIEGIVTLVKLKEYEGFWIQQREQAFNQKKLSRGIFIYHPRSAYKKLALKSGQYIRLLARVSEYHSLIHLKQVKALIECADNVVIPKPSLIVLPVSSLSDLDVLVGMRVYVQSSLKTPLIVSDLFGAGYGLGNYGQFAVSSKLHFQPTERYRAADIDSGKVVVANKILDYILVDDGYSARFPKFIPFPNSQGFSADNPLRIGDEVDHISAVLHRYGDYYILIPDGPVNNIQINSQLRPSQPIVSIKANIVIASINVENYFNGNPRSFNDLNLGFPTSRGAKNYSQFKRQTQKLVAAISMMDADIIALMELENDGYGEHSAIADLMRAVNKKMPDNQQYRYVIPKQRALGRDEITVGILYRNLTVTANDPVHVLDYSSHIKHQSRPSLLQRFIVEGKSFYLVVNHLKSKGRPCDFDQNKYHAIQGNCNDVRAKAARLLSAYIKQAIDPEEPILIVGDLNSYSQEDPLLLLEKSGYKNLNTISSINLRGSPIFSYSFQGYLGNLDHALANSIMLPMVRSIDSWSINSLEDILLKYDSDYAKPDAYRSSDHDPLVIGIEIIH